MKLTIATALAVILCLLSLAARSSAIRALRASPERAYAAQERLALAAIDGRLRHRFAKK